MPTKKDHETLTRELHTMVTRLCKRFDDLEPILLATPKMAESLKASLAEFRRDVRSRVSEVVTALTKKPIR